jgi:shikimate dehydrogenase
VRGFLADESELAAQVGAVNTVILDEAGRHGYNTDVYGIIQALGELGVHQVSHAVVLGGGATAASALAALRDLGCATVTVLARSPGRCGPLLEAAQRLAVTPRVATLDGDTVGAVLRRTQGPGAVVVSTVPVAAVEDLTEVLVGCGTPGAGGPALLDVLYDPWPTPLAAAWRQAGGRAVGGFSMLVHQAEGQVRLMTGQRPPLEQMRAAGQAELDRRAAGTTPRSTGPTGTTPSG